MPVVGKTKIFMISKKVFIEKLNLLLHTKYYDYSMFCWVYITGDMEYVILDHFLTILCPKQLVKSKPFKNVSKTCAGVEFLS